MYTIHSGTDYGWNSTLKLRDSSAWYHIVVIYDSSIGSGGMNAYINGVQITNFATDYGTLPSNEQGLVNAQNSHTIGRHQTSNGGFHHGYMAEIYFIDGAALDASYFGKTNQDIWIPKEYDGTSPTGPTITDSDTHGTGTGIYGTNGFHLDFSPASIVYNGTTITQINDVSGNNNHWAAN